MIILLRHAEKPIGKPEDPNLTDIGKARAHRLAVWIPATFGTINAIYATTPSDRSRRPLQTIEPLAAALRLPPRLEFGRNDLDALTRELCGREGAVLTCWVHEQIPDISRKLGAEPPFDPWPASEYDSVWVLAEGQLKVLSQS